jgi:hypothetical protein
MTKKLKKIYSVAQTVARRLAVRQAEFESRLCIPEEALYRADAMRISRLVLEENI